MTSYRITNRAFCSPQIHCTSRATGYEIRTSITICWAIRELVWSCMTAFCPRKLMTSYRITNRAFCSPQIHCTSRATGYEIRTSITICWAIRELVWSCMTAFCPRKLMTSYRITNRAFCSPQIHCTSRATGYEIRTSITISWAIRELVWSCMTAFCPRKLMTSYRITNCAFCSPQIHCTSRATGYEIRTSITISWAIRELVWSCMTAFCPRKLMTSYRITNRAFCSPQIHCTSRATGYEIRTSITISWAIRELVWSCMTAFCPRKLMTSYRITNCAFCSPQIHCTSRATGYEIRTSITISWAIRELVWSCITAFCPRKLMTSYRITNRAFCSPQIHCTSRATGYEIRTSITISWAIRELVWSCMTAFCPRKLMTSYRITNRAFCSPQIHCTSRATGYEIRTSITICWAIRELVWSCMTAFCPRKLMTSYRITNRAFCSPQIHCTSRATGYEIRTSITISWAIRELVWSCMTAFCPRKLMTSYRITNRAFCSPQIHCTSRATGYEIRTSITICWAIRELVWSCMTAFCPRKLMTSYRITNRAFCSPQIHCTSRATGYEIRTSITICWAIRELVWSCMTAFCPRKLMTSYRITNRAFCSPQIHCTSRATGYEIRTSITISWAIRELVWSCMTAFCPRKLMTSYRITNRAFCSPQIHCTSRATGYEIRTSITISWAIRELVWSCMTAFCPRKLMTSYRITNRAFCSPQIHCTSRATGYEIRTSITISWAIRELVWSCMTAFCPRKLMTSYRITNRAFCSPQIHCTSRATGYEIRTSITISWAIRELVWSCMTAFCPRKLMTSYRITNRAFCSPQIHCTSRATGYEIRTSITISWAIRELVWSCMTAFCPRKLMTSYRITNRAFCSPQIHCTSRATGYEIRTSITICWAIRELVWSCMTAFCPRKLMTSYRITNRAFCSPQIHCTSRATGYEIRTSITICWAIRELVWSCMTAFCPRKLMTSYRITNRAFCSPQIHCTSRATGYEIRTSITISWAIRELVWSCMTAFCPRKLMTSYRITNRAFCSPQIHCTSRATGYEIRTSITICWAIRELVWSCMTAFCPRKLMTSYRITNRAFCSPQIHCTSRATGYEIRTSITISWAIRELVWSCMTAFCPRKLMTSYRITNRAFCSPQIHCTSRATGYEIRTSITISWAIRELVWSCMTAFCPRKLMTSYRITNRAFCSPQIHCTSRATGYEIRTSITISWAIRELVWSCMTAFCPRKLMTSYRITNRAFCSPQIHCTSRATGYEIRTSITISWAIRELVWSCMTAFCPRKLMTSYRITNRAFCSPQIHCTSRATGYEIRTSITICWAIRELVWSCMTAFCPRKLMTSYRITNRAFCSPQIHCTSRATGYEIRTSITISWAIRELVWSCMTAFCPRKLMTSYRITNRAFCSPQIHCTSRATGYEIRTSITISWAIRELVWSCMTAFCPRKLMTSYRITNRAFCSPQIHCTSRATGYEIRTSITISWAIRELVWSCMTAFCPRKLMTSYRITNRAFCSPQIHCTSRATGYEIRTSITISWAIRELVWSCMTAFCPRKLMTSYRITNRAFCSPQIHCTSRATGYEIRTSITISWAIRELVWSCMTAFCPRKLMTSYRITNRAFCSPQIHCTSRATGYEIRTSITICWAIRELVWSCMTAFCPRKLMTSYRITNRAFCSPQIHCTSRATGYEIRTSITISWAIRELVWSCMTAFCPRKLMTSYRITNRAFCSPQIHCTSRATGYEIRTSITISWAIRELVWSCMTAFCPRKLMTSYRITNRAFCSPQIHCTSRATGYEIRTSITISWAIRELVWSCMTAFCPRKLMTSYRITNRAFCSPQIHCTSRATGYEIRTSITICWAIRELVWSCMTAFCPRKLMTSYRITNRAFCSPQIHCTSRATGYEIRTSITISWAIRELVWSCITAFCPWEFPSPSCVASFTFCCSPSIYFAACTFSQYICTRITTSQPIWHWSSTTTYSSIQCIPIYIFAQYAWTSCTYYTTILFVSILFYKYMHAEFTEDIMVIHNIVFFNIDKKYYRRNHYNLVLKYSFSFFIPPFIFFLLISIFIFLLASSLAPSI